MRFSSDGAHLLGGTGGGGVYLDGTLIASHAGGWDWVALEACAGAGGFDTSPHGQLVAYNLPQQALSVVADPWAASFFYARPGYWLAYLADGKTWSFDSAGRSYPGKVALGVSAHLDAIFTDANGTQLEILSTGGMWQVVPDPSEWTLLPSGGYFSRNYRGCFVNAIWYACGYLPDPGGLCVWQPFVSGSPVWLLSGDGHDFNADIAVRQSDGLLVVGSGINQGESGQRLYALDLWNHRFSLNGGSWQPLTEGPAPQPPLTVHVDPLPRHIRAGYFFKTSDRYGDNPSAPGNCEVRVVDDSGYERATLPLVALSTLPDASGEVVYLDTRFWPEPPPPLRPGQFYGLQAYCGVGETISEFWTAIGLELLRFPVGRVALVFQAYDRNGSETNLTKLKDLQATAPEFARQFPQVAMILWFSDGRPGGTRDHEDLREWHYAIMAAIPAAPEPEPEPPQPEPEPPQPEPPNPEPEPPMSTTRPTPQVGDLGAWRLDSSHPWRVAEVIRNQDDDWIPGCISLRNRDSGKVEQWNSDTGMPSGEADIPVGTGAERTRFDGMNLLTTLPANNPNATVALEWINLPARWTN